MGNANGRFLCPLRHAIRPDNNAPGGHITEFMRCLEEKCAWWVIRTEHNVDGTETTYGACAVQRIGANFFESLGAGA